MFLALLDLYYVLVTSNRGILSLSTLIETTVLRRSPRVPEGFSSGCRGRSLGTDGSVPPYGGIPFGDLPAGLGHDLERPKQSPTRVSAKHDLAHSHP